MGPSPARVTHAQKSRVEALEVVAEDVRIPIATGVELQGRIYRPEYPAGGFGLSRVQKAEGAKLIMRAAFTFLVFTWF